MESNGKHKECIVVRSLTDSDLGWFDAHRPYTASKQRAININAEVAAVMLSPTLLEAGEIRIRCISRFCGIADENDRHIGKVGKNWRLGGNKLDGEIFANVNSKDFLLIRTVAGNDGTSPMEITFITRKTDAIIHARLVEEVGPLLKRSMTTFEPGTEYFELLSGFFPPSVIADKPFVNGNGRKRPVIPPMPKIRRSMPGETRTVQARVRSPHILEQMFKAAGELSAVSHLEFMQVLENLADELRRVLLHTSRIVQFDRDHSALWREVAGKTIGFVDGGMANLAMLGAAPVAARVGCYIVTPGIKGDDREQFVTTKQLIDELYAGQEGGIYKGGFPDTGALREAARISVEAGGAVEALRIRRDLRWLFLHGSLVNPVSRYTDLMEERQIRAKFPDFSRKGLEALLPPTESNRAGRDANFISVYLRQLELLRESSVVICGVVERESVATSVYQNLLHSLEDQDIASVLHKPPSEWRKWFIDNVEYFRITDALLFRCVLMPGEALWPVEIDRNTLHKAPDAWKAEIACYPRPYVSYLLPNEWGKPFRIEIFDKDLGNFEETARLLMHCALLLPRYAFPVGLDIVDKFAKIPDWMSRPVNTHTAVRAMKQALDSRDMKVFDGLRRLLCGSSRDWLLRPQTFGQKGGLR